MKAMVTGGAGFLGSHLVERLKKDGHFVRAVDLPGADFSGLQKQGVEIISGDLRDAGLVDRACAGMELVFHVAALASPWAPRELFWSINVTATDNVISACKMNRVRRLVHVSSPSAVFDGKEHFMADESLPYPKKFLSHYSETKAVSEQHVLAANGPDLETVVIRPHAIWGPGDRHLLPRVIARAKAGKMFQVGDGENLVSNLYVENAVDALLLAAGAKAAAGKAYFITDAEPVKIWELVRRILSELGVPGPRGVIPFWAAYSLAAVQELVWKLFQLEGEPNITRYTVSELAKNHTYSIEAAKKDLGYVPRVSAQEGLAKTLAWLRESGIPGVPKSRL